jgi:hypothetical protein
MAGPRPCAPNRADGRYVRPPGLQLLLLLSPLLSVGSPQIRASAPSSSPQQCAATSSSRGAARVHLRHLARGRPEDHAHPRRRDGGGAHGRRRWWLQEGGFQHRDVGIERPAPDRVFIFVAGGTRQIRRVRPLLLLHEEAAGGLGYLHLPMSELCWFPSNACDVSCETCSNAVRFLIFDGTSCGGVQGREGLLQRRVQERVHYGPFGSNCLEPKEIWAFLIIVT